MSEFQSSVELKVWLLRVGIRPEEIKEALELTQTAAVTQFINGTMTSRPIAAYLVGRGCPRDLVNVKTGRVAA